MAFGELQTSSITAFEVSADLTILCRLFWQTNDYIDLATTGPPKPDQSRSSLYICVSLIRTGESTVALTPPAPEQKKNITEEESVKPVALTYLTVVV